MLDNFWSKFIDRWHHTAVMVRFFQWDFWHSSDYAVLWSCFNFEIKSCFDACGAWNDLKRNDVTAGFASGGSGGCSLKALTPWFHIKIWEMDRNCLFYIYIYNYIYIYIGIGYDPSLFFIGIEWYNDGSTNSCDFLESYRLPRSSIKLWWYHGGTMVVPWWYPIFKQFPVGDPTNVTMVVEQY